MKTRYKMLFDIHIKSNIFSSTVVMIRHERISSLSHLKNLSRYLCALDWIAHHLSSKKGIRELVMLVSNQGSRLIQITKKAT